MRYSKPINSFPHNFVQPSGEIVRDTFTLDISPNGDQKLILSGSYDVQEQINSHRESCDLSKILEKHEMMGTLGLLAHNAKNGVVDTTTIPTNLHEMKKLLDKANIAFDNLKPEVKNNYENLEEFLSVFGSVSSLQSFLQQNSKSELPHVAEESKGDV